MNVTYPSSRQRGVDIESNDQMSEAAVGYLLNHSCRKAELQGAVCRREVGMQVVSRVVSNLSGAWPPGFLIGCQKQRLALQGQAAVVRRF